MHNLNLYGRMYAHNKDTAHEEGKAYIGDVKTMQDHNDSSSKAENLSLFLSLPFLLSLSLSLSLSRSRTLTSLIHNKHTQHDNTATVWRDSQTAIKTVNTYTVYIILYN